jgi:hypothetical protein
MKNKEIRYLPFVVGYLGKPDYQEVAKLMKQPEVDTFNALEKLVKKGKIKSEVVRGEVRYLPKETYRGEDDD